MMKCEPIIAALSDIVDGEATLWTRMMFTMHMMMCPKCRAYFRQFKEVRELAGAVQVDHLPPDFFRVMEDTLHTIPKDIPSKESSS